MMHRARKSSLRWVAAAAALWTALAAPAAPAQPAAEPSAAPTIRARLAPLVDPGRLKIDDISTVKTPAGSIVKVTASFDFADPRGQRQQARTRIVLPPALSGAAPAARFPLLYHAGYELSDEPARNLAGLGYVVVTSLSTSLNPLSRTPNLDLTLLHIARDLPFVDDSKVFIWGGSAGGYMTLMLAAETFPLSGAFAEVPPVNLGYEMRYFEFNKDRVAKTLGPDGKPTTPILNMVTMLADQSLTYLPADRQAATWRALSPAGNVERITAPITATFSTADILVPMQQVSPTLVLPHDPSGLPPGFQVDPASLLPSPAARFTLLESLGEGRYKLFRLDMPSNTPPVGGPPRPMDTPIDPARPWNIIIIDEGPLRASSGHYLHSFFFSTAQLLAARNKLPIAADQLTPDKLRQLMDRYTGSEWITSGLRHLDDPPHEKADVLRGLLTYCQTGPDHAARFLKLYRALPADRRPLGPRIDTATAQTLADELRALRAAGGQGPP